MQNNCEGPIHPNAIAGMELFNSKQFFEAHEELEIAWKEERDEVRNLYRGILQVAVVYLHIERGNYNGAIKVYDRCIKWLNAWPGICKGIQVGNLRSDLEAVVREIRHLGRENISAFNTALFKEVKWSEKKVWTCDRCGTEMYERNCKVSCPNCGNRFDCSDLNIYFD